MQSNGAGVRKCLVFGLRNIFSTVLSLLIVSLLCLDQSSRWPNSVATSTDDFSATSKVVSSAYLIIRLCSDIGLRSKAYCSILLAYYFCKVQCSRLCVLISKLTFSCFRFVQRSANSVQVFQGMLCFFLILQVGLGYKYVIIPKSFS